MATSRVVWNAERFNARLRGVLQGRAQRAVNVVVGDTQRRVSTPYPPASQPGEPPHRRTGALMRSISGGVTMTRNTITATVRARAPHAKHLDPGGGRIAQRPFIGLPQDFAKMARIMARGS
jgi:hypothetical protein